MRALTSRALAIVINSAPVGFLASKCDIATKPTADADVMAKAEKSLGALAGTGRLGTFVDC